MEAKLKEKIADFLSHERIAVAGVSRDSKSGSAANGIYKRFKERGYQVFAINPNATEVEGDPCYHSVKDIPGLVDGVIIATPASATDTVVHDCADVGITRVWMHYGVHGAGSSVSQSAVNYCESHDITVIAGACPLMFGKPSDGFHRFIGKTYGVLGMLPN